MTSAADQVSARPAWYVTAKTNGSGDHVERFIREGIWENLSPKFGDYSDDVNSIRIGDRIAIKSEYNRNEPETLPFDSGGEKVRSMMIKATGIVIANPRDGCTLKVDWTPVVSSPKWYFYTLSKPVHRVPPNQPNAKNHWC